MIILYFLFTRSNVFGTLCHNTISAKQQRPVVEDLIISVSSIIESVVVMCDRFQAPIRLHCRAEYNICMDNILHQLTQYNPRIVFLAISVPAYI